MVVLDDTHTCTCKHTRRQREGGKSKIERKTLSHFIQHIFLVTLKYIFMLGSGEAHSAGRGRWTSEF